MGSTQKIYQKYARSMLALEDFLKCRKFLEDMTDDSDSWAEEIAFIVIYSRNFTNDNDRNKSIFQSLPASVLDGLKPDQITLHERIIKEWRNRLVVHSEMAVLKPIAEFDDVGSSFRHIQNDGFINSENINEFNKLLKHVEINTVNFLRNLKQLLPKDRYEISV